MVRSSCYTLYIYIYIYSIEKLFCHTLFPVGLFLQPTLMHNSITTCMSHYYPRHVSGLDMPILRRNNCTNTASGILALLSGCTLHRCSVQPLEEIILYYDARSKKHQISFQYFSSSWVENSLKLILWRPSLALIHKIFFGVEGRGASAVYGKHGWNWDLSNSPFEM